MQAQNMSSISFRSMQDRRVLTSTGGNTNRSSLSVGEGSPRATITCTTPGSSKVAHRRSAQKHTEQECMKQKEKDETMLEEPVKKNRQKKRTTWRVETFCRIKPQVNSSSPSAKHFRSIPYELRHGQGPLGADPPHRRLRIGVAGSGTGGMAFNSRRQEMDFSFTEVFPPAITQDQVYHRVASAVVDSVLHGYNGTIFAYGQTGSGKTFTMTGGDSFDERGLIPRAITDVYDTIRQTPDRRFKVLISYMEIYKESAYDLLDVSTRTKPLEGWTKIQMMDDEDGEMNLRNLKLYEATSEEDALNLLFLGNWHRITSSTPMNEASTRSHCIFTIRIQADPLLHGIPNRPSKSTFGKLNLVDLAGSERLFKTDNHQSSSSSSSGSGLAASNYTRMEGKYINLSLHYLEQVIIALQEKARRQKDEDEEGQGRPGLVRGSSSSSFTSSSLYPSSPSSYHIPYRNSVMTSILRDSLGGNCRTVFVVTLNTELDHLEESLSTCRFAQRCAQLSTDVLANEEVNPDQLTASLQAEVLRLRRKISAQETALATALTQTQEEESKNAWRGLTGAEKHLCRDVVRGFVQVASSLPASPPSSPPSGPLSVPPHYEWIYTLARPLVAYCARLLLLWGEAVREEGRKEKKEGVMKYQQEQWKRHQRLEQAHHHQHRSSVGERPTSGFALLQQQQQQQQREPDAQITPHIHTSFFATAAPTAPLSIASPHQEGKEAEAEAEARNEGRRVRGLLQQGHVFFKLGKGERKHERFVWVALDMTRLHWRKERKGEKKGGNKGEDEGEHKNGNPPISSSFLVLSDCQRVAAGRDGERGEKEGKREEEKGVFFTLYSHDRYVTFEVPPSPHAKRTRNAWVAALASVLQQQQLQSQALSPSRSPPLPCLSPVPRKTLTRSKASRPAMNLAVHPVPREEQKRKEAGHRREEGKEGDLCHQHHHRQQHKEVKEGEEEMIRQQQVGQQQQRYSPPLGLFATEHLDQEQRQEYHSSSIPSLSLPPSEEPSRYIYPPPSQLQPLLSSTHGRQYQQQAKECHGQVSVAQSSVPSSLHPHRPTVTSSPPCSSLQEQQQHQHQHQQYQGKIEEGGYSQDHDRGHQQQQKSSVAHRYPIYPPLSYFSSKCPSSRHHLPHQQNQKGQGGEEEPRASTTEMDDSEKKVESPQAGVYPIYPPPPVGVPPSYFYTLPILIENTGRRTGRSDGNTCDASSSPSSSFSLPFSQPSSSSIRAPKSQYHYHILSERGEPLRPFPPPSTPITPCNYLSQSKTGDWEDNLKILQSGGRKGRAEGERGGTTVRGFSLTTSVSPSASSFLGSSCGSLRDSSPAPKNVLSTANTTTSPSISSCPSSRPFLQRSNSQTVTVPPASPFLRRPPSLPTTPMTSTNQDQGGKETHVPYSSSRDKEGKRLRSAARVKLESRPAFY